LVKNLLSLDSTHQAVKCFEADLYKTLKMSLWFSNHTAIRIYCTTAIVPSDTLLNVYLGIQHVEQNLAD